MYSLHVKPPKSQIHTFFLSGAPLTPKPGRSKREMQIIFATTLLLCSNWQIYYKQNRIRMHRYTPLKRYQTGLGAVHKVRHAIFDQFLPPPPVTLRHTSPNPPSNYLTPLPHPP